MDDEEVDNDVAVIGIAGHFPGAADPDELWTAIEAGRDCISDITTEGAVEAGIAADQANDPNYVLRAGTLTDVEHFDPDFFGIGPRDAAIMDPQHRHFIECVWEALESAAHTPEDFGGSIGLFAGCGMNTYLLHNLLTNPDLVDQLGWFLLRHTANDKDFLTTTASYHLGLEGPSVNVQTACSTSLVAVHLAVQSLLGFECDMALAGGSTIEFPHGVGYLFRPGEILSPDGVCRAYDAQSGGTVLTSGAAVVALRRLEDAVEEGDPILAVIKGSAINNDGRRKVSYLAPSVDGHTDVIREALSVAGLDARSIQLLEGHGTGTALGDPIEVAALTEAFRSDTDDVGFCRLGSTKPNIGHLDTAAGTASLIKVVQALRHKVLPAIANHTGPSEMASLDDSPFVLSGESSPWTTEGPRRAGVSSLGVGGTNAHVIVEEAPVLETDEPETGPVALLVTGKTRKAVSDASERLADYLETNPEVDLHAVANTLATGRRKMDVRRVVVANNISDAVERLRTTDRATSHTGSADHSEEDPNVVFMFPGGGAQYVGMGSGLGDEFAIYHETIRDGIERVRDCGGPDLTPIFDATTDEDQARATTSALPAVFLTSLALAKQWMAWGVAPTAMLGHSLGEYVAAHLAGVLSLDDALKLVVVRSELMERATGQGRAAMLAVPVPEDELVGALDDQLSLATVNAADECVVAGPIDAIETLATSLENRGLEPTRIPLMAAAHSSMLNPVLDEFLETVRSISLNTPDLPYLSNLTGDWITDAQATDPQYWVSHLRSTVRFGDGLQAVLAKGPTVLIELGPGHSLSSYARRSEVQPLDTIAALRHPNHACNDDDYTRLAFARQWINDVEVDLDRWTGAGLRRLNLPTYPFQREPYWIEPGTGSAIGNTNAPSESGPSEPVRIDTIDKMFWKPVWAPDVELSTSAEPQAWFISGSGPIPDRIANELESMGHEAMVADGITSLDPELYRNVVLTGPEEPGLAVAGANWVHQGAAAAKMLAASSEPANLVALTHGGLSAEGQAKTPLDALALGPTGTAPKEYPNLIGRVVDADPARPVADQASLLVHELVSGTAPVIAHRDQARLVPKMAQTVTHAAEASKFAVGGTYLITGGLGGVGYELASYLACEYGANLVLTSSSPLPEASDEEQWLASHGPNDSTSRRLRRLAELRAKTNVTVLVADLEETSGLAMLLDEAKQQVGHIDGAIHAAGTIRDKLIEFAEPDDHDFVLGAKVQGALGLIDALNHIGADFLVLISSTSTTLRSEGQTSYVAANAVLDSLAGQHGALSVSTLNYGLWSGTGLASDLARRARLGLIDGVPVAHPVLEEMMVDQKGATSIVGHLDSRYHWVVDEHRSENGLAVLPGTGQIDLMLSAVDLAGLDRHRLSSMALYEPLVVPADTTVMLRVNVSADSSDNSKNRTVRLESDSGGDWRLHSEAELQTLTGVAPRLDLAATAERIQLDHFNPLDGPRRHLQLGRRWDTVTSARRGVDEAFATLELRDPTEADLWTAHPALLDTATAVGVALGSDAEDVVYVPIGYDEVRSYQKMPVESVVHAQKTDASTEDVLVVDVTVANPDGAVVIELQGLQLRPVADPGTLGQLPSETIDQAGLPPLLGLADSLGIRPPEGVEMLERLLAGDTRLLVGSTIDLDYLLEAANDDTAQAGPGDHSLIGAEMGVEAAVEQMWISLLGVAEVKPEDDFFDLGGHSLIAIRLIARIQQELDVRLQLATVFEVPTFRDVVALVESLRDEDGESADNQKGNAAPALPLAPVVRSWVDDRVTFPASSAQKRLWFVDQLEPGKAVYNIPYHHQVRLRGPLDVEAVQKAVSALVDRHETLRTTFETVDGEPVQVIRRSVDSSMPVIDLSGMNPAEREAEMQRIVDAEATHQFDLVSGPLFFTKLLKMSDEDHVFTQLMSHIVVDGLSLGMIADELTHCYEAFSTGNAPSLPELDFQYADFVMWHQEWLDGPLLEEQLDYWKGQLSGRLPVLDLPTDRPRPPVQANNGSWEWIHLESGNIDELRELSRSEGVSLFMTMLAAFNILMHRYSGQDDILVGTPTANRSQPELEQLIAFFINPIVLRSDMSEDPTFADFLGGVRDSSFGALANQDIPFDRLVEELRPDRNLSHHPLFQVSFTLQMAPPLMQLAGTVSEGVEFDNGTAKFDLLVELWEAESGGISGRFEYDSDLFDRETIRRLIANYKVLLRSAASTPEAKVSQLAIVDPAEPAQIDLWNDTTVDYDRAATIHSLFEAAVADHAESTAVTCGNTQLSYGELNSRANRLARHLMANGVNVGDTIGLSVSRSVDMLVALLGVMKAGGAYLPLDPDYPADRLHFILSDADAKLLITESHLTDLWTSFTGPIITLDNDWDQIAANDDSNPAIDIKPPNLAYVIHTSGSTGLPKGVQVRHGNVVNFLTSMATKPGLGANDVLLAVTTLSFDIAVLELYLPLIVGAKVVIAGPDIQGSGELLAKALIDEDVTVMQATPASWKLLLSAGWDGKTDLKVLCGGELLPRELAEELLPRCHELWNMYGPTETTVWSAVKQVTTGTGPVPIGDPIANTELHILDKHLQPTPIGVPGELCIGGEGVTAGYLNRAELNTDRFVPDPMSKHDGPMLYRTGDLCRYRADGTIEFQGRIDLQVKVRGFRIELGEIEIVLGQHQMVTEAVVTAQSDPSGDNRLVAYVMPSADTDIAAGDLREHLAKSLPPYMVPTLFVPMTEWPLTNNGKIDRRALPSPGDAELTPAKDRIAPRDETEQQVADIWSELLGVNDIGVEDNFFELGGHSLLAAQIISQVNETFDVTVPLAELFTNPVVAHVAEQIATARLLDEAPADEDDDREEFVL